MNKHTRLSIILVLLTAAVYVPLILQQSDFRTDDYYLLTLIAEHGIVSPFDGQHYQYFSAFRLVPMLTLAVDYAIHGSNPMGYYFFNLAVQIAIVLVFFNVLRRIFDDFFDARDELYPFLMALILAFHADLFYNVVWISNRTEGLLLLLYLCAVAFFLRFYQLSRWVDYFLALTFTALTLLTKEQAIHLPLLVAILAVVTTRTSGRRWSAVKLVGTLLPVVMLAASILLLRWIFDPGASFFVSWYSGKKLFSLVGINLIAFHPTAAEPLFHFFVQHKLAAAVAGLMAAAVLLFILRRSDRRKRWVVTMLLLIFIAISFPRVLYHVLPRINSIQAAFLLVAIGILLLGVRRKWRYGMVIALLLAHAVGMYVELREWRKVSSNDRYVELLASEGERGGMRNYLFLTWYHDHARYAMYYLRHGRFGSDPSVRRLPLYLDRRYGTGPGPEFSYVSSPNGLSLRTLDPRAVFLYDSTLSSLPDIDVRFGEPATDYGYKRADITFRAWSDSIAYVFERNDRFEILNEKYH